jgi:hypothetical protein
MKIKRVTINNYKKAFEVETAKGVYSMPFTKCELLPSEKDRISKVYVDPELAREGITYVLESGEENSLMLDAFLDYNRDPEYMRKMLLYRLTTQVLELIAKSGVSKRELARKLHTSPAQLYRLLDTTNYSKTVDNMVRLLGVLGVEVDFRIVKSKAA